MNLSEAQLLENRKKNQISNFNIYFSNIRFISKSNFNKGADSLLAYRSHNHWVYSYWRKAGICSKCLVTGSLIKISVSSQWLVNKKIFEVLFPMKKLGLHSLERGDEFLV